MKIRITAACVVTEKAGVSSDSYFLLGQMCMLGISSLLTESLL